MDFQVKENNIAYELDFSKVYWNPRLSTEHGRIVELLKPGDVLFDVFAGIGPFAIPAAKKKCHVFANDLNPESYKWLLHNCKLNKVDNKIKAFNMDGRDFLLGPVREELSKELQLLKEEQKTSFHIVMNLPALAIEFLDVFRYLLAGEPCSTASLPTVHCYGFSKHDDPAKDIQERAEASLGTSLDGRCSTYLVRNVAPNKEMLCISFQIPADVLYKRPCPDEGEEQAPFVALGFQATPFVVSGWSHLVSPEGHFSRVTAMLYSGVSVEVAGRTERLHVRSSCRASCALGNSAPLL